MKNVRDEIRLKCYTGKCAQIKKKKFQRTQWVIFPALIAANPNPNNAKNNTQYTKTTETNNIYTQFGN